MIRKPGEEGDKKEGGGPNTWTPHQKAEHYRVTINNNREAKEQHRLAAEKAREQGDAKKIQARVYAAKYVGGRTDVVDY